MQLEQLITPRLILIKISTEAYNSVFTTMTDAEIMALYGFDEKGLEKEKFRFANGVTTFNKKLLYFLLKDKETHKTIGVCGYHTWYIEHDRAELFYHIHDEKNKRQGLMTEALQAVLHYGFTEMKLNRAEAMTATYNIASQKTLAKFGFVFEGTLKEHYNVEGIYEDSFMYSLLKHKFNYG